MNADHDQTNRRDAETQRRNPWEVRINGRTCITLDAVSRIDRLKTMTAAELRDVLAWPDTQKTVRAAARRRLDHLAAGGAR
jgi:pantothenate kinase-related protein Tda10